MTARRWLWRGVIVLAMAAVLHVFLVWLIPRAITGLFISRALKQGSYNRIAALPLPTDKSRAVVRPSPDLLYSACIFDVSAGPVRVSARLPGNYWSLSLFDLNSDNFFRVSDREIPGDRVEVILSSLRDSGAIKAKNPAAIVVRPPSTTGFLLIRSLVLDPGNMAREIEAQADTRCEALR